MDIKESATTVTQVYPKMMGNNLHYHMITYAIGQMCPIPSKGFALELVERIIVSYGRHLIVEVTFRDYGVILLTDYIVEIRYEKDDYREVRDAREKAKRDKDKPGEQQGIDQDN